MLIVITENNIQVIEGHKFAIGVWVNTKKGYDKIAALYWDIKGIPKYVMQSKECLSERDIEEVSGMAQVLMRRNCR